MSEERKKTGSTWPCPQPSTVPGSLIRQSWTADVSPPELRAESHAPPRRPALNGVTNGLLPAVGSPPETVTGPMEVEFAAAAAAAAIASAAVPAASTAAPRLIGEGATTWPEVVRTGTGRTNSPAAGCKLKGIPKVVAF